MSEGLNRVILLGHLGADPELRYTANGTAVMSVRVATNESFVDKNKETQERTDWHQVVVWGARAEALSKLLTKGMCVLAEGSLRTSSYEKDGVKRYRTEIHAREICLAGRRAGARDGDTLDGLGAATAPPPAQRTPVASRAPAKAVRQEPLEEMPY